MVSGKPPSPDNASRHTMAAVLKLLRRAYGSRSCEPTGDPVATLMGTILSQNTNQANSTSGYRRLREQFASWQEMADAPVAKIVECIRTSGLAETKAPRMRSILRRIRAERGKITLSFLAEMPPEQAYDYLVAMNGVGPKTAWCVLLFALGAEVFPVDTHIHRIAVRLGIIAPRTSPERAHHILRPLIRPADRYETHVLLIAHGRRKCLPKRPKCDLCNLLKLCPHGQRLLDR